MMETQQWLETRCLDGDGIDAPALARRKAADRLTVTVCLPALNVEQTVGPIVQAIRAAHMDDVQLVDELVVINGPSRDQTARQAAAAGARVVDERDVLAEAGAGSGKGDALWKSLAATSGDLILWLDADVHGFDPSVVPAMLAPLIEQPEVAFVKAHYRRAFEDSPAGGGRVTELCARPLLNLYFPELAVFAQPLAGEVAGRRDLLETIPFCGGYGVEIAMLIDVWRAVGLGAMAQVDLGSRRHNHQDLAALGQMAFTITQAVLRRAVGPGAQARSSYVRAEGAGEGKVRLTESTVSLEERPPMANLGVPQRRAD
jgi:glucosyl-3-phosphoglycerate synthase